MGRELARRIYEFTRSRPVARDHVLSGQMRRAALSAMSSVADSFERDTSVECLRSLSAARASCVELRSLLYVASDSGLLGDAAFDDLLARISELGRLVSELRATMTRKIEARASRMTWRPPVSQWPARRGR